MTGGAKRIGRALALAGAQAGAEVAITYLKSASEAEITVADIKTLDRQAYAFRCDVRDPLSIRSACAEVIRSLGGLDILINNAGSYQTARFEELNVEQWDEAFNTNTRGPFLTSQALLPELRRAQGRIINIGSLGGIRPWATHAHYCASKAALHMLTQSMAKAFAPEISVNCVAPGMIDLGEKDRAEMFLNFAQKTPMEVNGTAADVVAAVMFFATAPAFITGQIMTVDGGLGLV